MNSVTTASRQSTGGVRSWIEHCGSRRNLRYRRTSADRAAAALNVLYGRRRTFLVGLVSFGVISVLCGLSPSIEVLIVLRILQGAAGALLVRGSLALLRTAYADEQSQGPACETWAGAGATTNILGPLMGGFLIETFS
jgi:MFS family permease